MNHNELISNIQSSQKEERALYLELQKIPNDNTSIEVQKEIDGGVERKEALNGFMKRVQGSID